MKKRFAEIFFVLLIFQGCLEETFLPGSAPPDDTDANLMLAYINSQGFFRNALGEPYLVTPLSVYSNPDNYHIIDLRTREEYTNGHISGAINVRTDSLITYLENLQNGGNKTYLLVCNNGQSSSYAQCLIGTYGFRNVAALKYGMASWNEDFASIWSNNIKTIEQNDIQYPLDNKSIFPEEHHPLPVIQLPEDRLIKNQVNQRIKTLLSAPQKISSDLLDSETVYCDFSDVYQYYNKNSRVFEQITLLCYGGRSLYSLYPTKYDFLPSHPIGTYWLNIPLQFDYRVSNSVHFLSNTQPVVLYSSDGHSSAFVVALLRLLGYDAKSMQYGTNSFQYEGMTFYFEVYGMIFSATDEIREDAFSPGKYGNYPYVTGTNP